VLRLPRTLVVGLATGLIVESVVSAAVSGTVALVAQIEVVYDRI
jgi:hypothetical protein